jgi:hypothetical protein
MLDQRQGRTVTEVMEEPAATAPSWWTVTDFIGDLAMARTPSDVFVLVDLEGHPDGVLRVARLAQVPPDRRDSTRPRDCRDRPDPLVVSADAPLGDVAVPIEFGPGIAVVVQDAIPIVTLSGRSIRSAVARSRLGLPTPSSPAA